MASMESVAVSLGLGSAFLLIGLLVGRKALTQFGRGYRLLTTDVVDTADVSPGTTAAVSGVVEAQGGTGEFPSPFTDDAVFCYTEVQTSAGSGGDDPGGGTWDTFHWNYEGVPFEVADTTGTVAVDPPNCPADARTSVPEMEVDLPMETVTFESDAPMPDGLPEYIEHIDGFRGGSGSGLIRFRQGLLTPGDDVFVLGEATNGTRAPVIDGTARPEAFVLSDEKGGSPGKNIVFGLFLSVFALLGTGAGGYLISLLVT